MFGLHRDKPDDDIEDTHIAKEFNGKCDECNFETIYENELSAHKRKHVFGSRIIEYQAHAHEKALAKGYITEREAIAMKMCDLYIHLSIDLQDSEQLDKWFKSSWISLDKDQHDIFMRYLANRLITVGRQIDHLVNQPKVIKL